MSDTTTQTVPGADVDTLVPGLYDSIADTRQSVRFLRNALARSVWGAMHGEPWADADSPPAVDDIVAALDMNSTPPGMTARETLFRQSLHSMFAALDAVDSAGLAAWTAVVNLDDPGRRA